MTIEFTPKQASHISLLAYDQLASHRETCPICPFRTLPCWTGQNFLTVARKWDVIAQTLEQCMIAGWDINTCIICHRCHHCVPEVQCVLLTSTFDMKGPGWHHDPIRICSQCDDKEIKGAGLQR